MSNNARRSSANVKFVFNFFTFVMCQRSLDKAGLFCRKSSRHIGNGTGNGGLIHNGGVAYNLKETFT